MSQFNDLVAASDTLKARFATIADVVIREISAKHGVEVTRADVAALPCVQLATFANSNDHMDWQKEAGALEAVKSAQDRKRLADALGAAADDPANILAVDMVNKMTPEQKIRFARANDLVTPKDGGAPEQTEIESKAALLKQAEMMRGGAKIAFARKHSLL